MATPQLTETKIYIVPRDLEHELFNRMVALKAWQIWKEEGCPDGRADAHWKQAEAALMEVREIQLKGAETPSMALL